MSASSLSRALAPRSIAVIGASPTPGKAGNALVRSLTGFPGAVHPVHPHADSVLGHRAYPSVAALPQVPDLALVAVPAAAAPGVVRECGEAGVAGAVVHAGGFAEAGEEGQRLQEQLAAAAAETGIRVLGPNTSGFIAPHLGLCASFVGAAAGIPAGPLAIVAQSGGVNHALAFAAQAEGIGVRLAVGLGNAIDVGFADVLEQLAGDAATQVVALAIEGVEDGRRLVDAVGRLVDDMPVVAIKVGRSDVTEFAQSHTGALTGSWKVTRSALRQAGAVVVDDTTALLDAARALALSRLPAREHPGVGLVTGQAGPGLLLADALGVAGVAVPELPSETQQTLASLVGSLTYLRNPVDTGRPGESFPEVLRTVAAADAVDLLAVYALDEPEAIDAASVLSNAAAGPRLLGTAGPPAAVATVRERLARDGVPVYASPERTASAAAALVADAQARHRRRAAGPSRVAPASGGDAVHASAAGTGDAASGWDEDRAKRLVAAAGVPTPARRVCADHAEALAAAQELGYPVVAKLVHPHLRHKTELGAVRIGLREPAALAAALAELAAVPAPDGARYLVETMAAPGPELLLGAVRDPAFGPLVVLGAGGVGAEVDGDVAIRLAPLSEQEAATMLGELASAERYRGFRGAAAVDEAALARALVAVAQLIAARPEIAELEVNPLRVGPDGGLLALDALVVERAAGDDGAPADGAAVASATGAAPVAPARRTALHDRHVAAGAKLVPFAGWEMPVQYAGIREEHAAVRARAGVFDVSHMGEVETRGPDALAFLQRVLSNDVSRLAVGGAQYSVLCREDGGVLDDLFTYRLGEDRFLTITNAANHERDLAWLKRHATGFGVELIDRIDDFAMLAVQGPAARGIVAQLVDGGELPGRFRTAELSLAGETALVCGTGYTGEDGVEILCAPGAAPALWDAVVAGGAVPAGLGARDTLRLEVCFHLYGNDLTTARGPIEAGLGWCCKEETGFVGSEAVRAMREQGPPERLVPFRVEGSGIARQGNPVHGGGEVTSGTLSPSLGVGIGMAYLPTARAVPGERFEIDVRGRTRTAVVVEKPIYRSEGS